MGAYQFWRDVKKRWRELDKKGLGIGGIAVLLLFEGIKLIAGAPLPSGWVRGVGYLLLGVIVTAYYLLREVDIEDAKEAAEEVKEKAEEKVDEATGEGDEGGGNQP